MISNFQVLDHQQNRENACNTKRRSSGFQMTTSATKTGLKGSSTSLMSSSTTKNRRSISEIIEDGRRKAANSLSLLAANGVGEKEERKPSALLIGELVQNIGDSSHFPSKFNQNGSGRGGGDQQQQIMAAAATEFEMVAEKNGGGGGTTLFGGDDASSNARLLF